MRRLVFVKALQTHWRTWLGGCGISLTLKPWVACCSLTSKERFLLFPTPGSFFILRYLEVSQWFRNALQSTLQGATHLVIIPDGVVFGGPVECGTKQRCPLSCYLFVLCFDVHVVLLVHTVLIFSEALRAYADGFSILLVCKRRIAAVFAFFESLAPLTNIVLNASKCVWIISHASMMQLRPSLLSTPRLS